MIVVPSPAKFIRSTVMLNDVLFVAGNVLVVTVKVMTGVLLGGQAFGREWENARY
jgi:hypothetical protein